MPIQIIQRDITKMKCDIIVNPTDTEYSGSGGVDFQIHRDAGDDLKKECKTLAPLTVGDVHLTKAYALPCNNIIHTVGPVWYGGSSNEEILLRSCYINALLLALKSNAKSIAFPLISSGTFGFPKDRVMRLALRAISDFLFVNDCDLDVFICVIDRDCYELGIGTNLKQFLNAEISHVAIEASPDIEMHSQLTEEVKISSSLDEWLKKHDDNFAVTLLKLIDKKGMTDVECYKKANVSRKTFSKINTDKNYHPSKQTAIAFAVALQLDMKETEQLLKTVGYSLSHSKRFDLIIEFCIKNKIYDIFEINEILYKYDQVLLG